MERKVLPGMGLSLLALALTGGVLGCTTTKRAAQLVIDHHVGMAQGAMDIMSGKAEEREQRLAKLQADLEHNRTALATAADEARKVELLEQHVALQDALIAELMQGHGHHGGQQHASAESGDEQQPAGHQH